MIAPRLLNISLCILQASKPFVKSCEGARQVGRIPQCVKKENSRMSGLAFGMGSGDAHLFGRRRSLRHSHDHDAI